MEEIMSYEKIIFIVYLAILAFISVFTFFLYGYDKHLAKKNGGPNRIKECYLLGLSAFGGALGAFIGRILFHHKTDKLYFSITIYLSILVEVATAVFLGYVAFKGVSL